MAITLERKRAIVEAIKDSLNSHITQTMNSHEHWEDEFDQEEIDYITSTFVIHYDIMIPPGIDPELEEDY